MKTQIFSHRGVIGITVGTETVNNPEEPGQIGVIVHGTELEITQGAFDILLGIKKDNGSLGDVMCWQAGENVCFGWLGGPNAVIIADYVTADRDYKPELLQPFIVPKIEIQAEFIKLVNENLEAPFFNN